MAWAGKIQSILLLKVKKKNILAIKITIFSYTCIILYGINKIYKSLHMKNKKFYKYMFGFNNSSV